MKDSGINWTTHTFNPWIGCSRVSPGCVNCYAENQNKFHQWNGGEWGPGAPRKITSDQNWKQPLSWDRAAAAVGERHRVFCASLADWCDVEAPAGQRDHLFNLIKQTPNLDWLLLTKRADRIAECLPPDWGHGYENVWLGVTCEDRKYGLPRINVLRNIPATVRFLSVEPLIEDLGEIDMSDIQWVIVGGESGNGARAFDTEWAESIVDQCHQQGVAVWMKQLGKVPVESGSPFVILGPDEKPSRHNDDMEMWPEHLPHLRVRELPDVGIDPALSVEIRSTFEIDARLSDLAKNLTQTQAADEIIIRHELIGNQLQLVSSRYERAKLIRRYRDLYAPLGLFKDFIAAIQLPKRTAYDLLQIASSAESALDEQKPKKPVKAVTADQVVKKATLSVERLVSSLPEEDQGQVVSEIIEALLAEYAVALPDTSQLVKAA